MDVVKYFGMLLLWSFCLSAAFAQDHPFSNEVVIDTYGNETMPYARGEVKKSLNVLYQQFPKEFYNRYNSTLDEIAGIAQRWDKLSPPQGFRASFLKFLDVGFNSAIYESPQDDALPYYTSRLEIVCEPFYKSESGQPQVAQIGIGSVATVIINNPYAVVGTPLIEDIYVCPHQTADFYGYPIYQTNRDEITVASNKQIPLFLPVSQQEYLQAHIDFWEFEIEKNKAEQEKPENQLSTKATVDVEKAERQKAMDEAYRELLKFDKAAAEELKKSSIEFEAQLAEGMLNNPEAAISKSDVLEKGNSLAQQTLAALRAELASLTPDQRKKQAHYHVDAQEIYRNRSGLVPFEYAEPRINCEPLVRVNKAIVDSANPNPQLMVIDWSILFTGAESCQSPRLFDSDEARYRAHTGDKAIVELYKQPAVWQNIFGLLVK
jgi:hypothetical protein